MIRAIFFNPFNVKCLERFLETNRLTSFLNLAVCPTLVKFFTSVVCERHKQARFGKALTLFVGMKDLRFGIKDIPLSECVCDLSM